MIKSKKSQITAFIIIGVVLLFSTALVLYIKGQVSAPAREVKVAVEKVPNEVQPVQQFVTDCLESVSKEALVLIGAHGGYVSVDSREYSGFTFEKNDLSPTEADVIAFPPSTKNYVPYWEYMAKPDNCEVCYLSSWRPPLYRTEGANSIESQVDKYVAANLRMCLNNFASFRKEGYSITEAGGLRATTFVRENDVLVMLNYSLDVSKGEGEKITMSLYQAALPVGLKNVYEMAKRIIDISAESRFLGMNTLNLISGFSSVDPDSLPPFGDLKFSTESVTWSKKAVKELLAQMLEVYVPAIQMEGTKNFNSPARFDDPIMNGLYGEMVLPGQRVTNLNVNFMYLGWPIYLDFKGASGDTLRPSTLEMPVLNLLPFKDYRSVYDLSYPVIVRVSDPSAFSRKGYTFAFAMETNIRNNDAISDEFVTFPAIGGEAISTSEFCSDSQRNSGPISVQTYDAETGQPLEGVNVIFKSSQQCSVGITEVDYNELSETYGTASITAKFPVGIGTLIISKPGYVNINEMFATSVDASDEKTFYLAPLKILNATITKKRIIGLGFSAGLLGAPEALGPNDIIILGIEKINQSPGEDPLVSMAAFGAGINSSRQEITLSPGQYKVTLAYILNQTVKIPEEEICSGGGPFGIGKQCSKIPELVFKPYSFPTFEYEWDVSAEELFGSSEVEFFTAYTSPPSRHDDLKTIPAMFGMFNNNLNYPQYKPVIS